VSSCPSSPWVPEHGAGYAGVCPSLAQTGIVHAIGWSTGPWADRASGVPPATACEVEDPSCLAAVVFVVVGEDVLPFSNMPAYLPPFLLRPEQAMTLAG